MARQIIDIGVEGNDGTGDAIRESFRKTNENFTELYAAFGIEGTINFASLSDTPEGYVNAENQIPTVNQTNTGLVFRELVSNGTLSGDPEDDTISFDFSEDGRIVVNVRKIAVVSDNSPAAGGPFNASSQPIGNVATGEAAAIDFTTVHGGSIEAQDLVPDIKYIDEKYLARGSAGETANVRNEPADATEYTLSISNFEIGTGYAVVSTHGLSRASTGAAYTYSSTGTDATDLVSDTTYYIRRFSISNIALYPTAIDARANTNKITAVGGTGTQTLLSDDYDANAFGFWNQTEALPRNSTVRRQGDQMDGPLYLNDHPGELAGVPAPGGIDGLQAATRFYVDQNSYYAENVFYVNLKGNDLLANTPIQLHGRSQQTAFRSINRACQEAEKIIISAPITTGPYLQTVTFDETLQESYTTSVGLSQIVAGRESVQNLVTSNREFIIEETIAYLAVNFPNLFYNESICRRDTGLILDGIVLDVLSGNNANNLSRAAGLRYYNNSSGLTAISTQLTETLAALTFTASVTSDVLQNIVVTSLQTGDGLITQTIDGGEVVNGTGLSAVAAKFTIIENIINNGPLEAPVVVDGFLYQVDIFNGGNGNVDQGDPNNTDLLPGKLVRGKSSGAVGKIVNYYPETDPSTSTTAISDRLLIELVDPFEFILGEQLEFGNSIAQNNITIKVETGTYLEDYPIKVPAQTSIVGDDFRRVIIKPRDRVSQSRWANTYFYRDLEFDGLTGDSSSVTGVGDANLPASGIAYINPLTSVQDGWFGRHYLYDPSSELNVSNFGVSNPGGFNDAAGILTRNRAFIAEEVVEYIDATYPMLTYGKETCRRDVGLIIDSVVSDLIKSGRQETLKAQGSYFYKAAATVVGAQSAETEDGILYIKTIATSVLANTAFGAKLGTVDQIIDTDYVPAASAPTNFNALIDCVAYAFDASYNPPRHNRDLDVMLMNDATRVANVTVQGHGGFMMVLDPDGQVLTKSPYCQVGSSFSQSVGRQAFRGGMYVDAFCANVPIIVDSKDDDFTLNVSSAAGTGLFVRRPQTPAPFYVDGRRFQVNAVTSYDQVTGTATLLLDRSSNTGTGFTGVTSILPTGVDLDSFPIDVTMQTAGNRSMLGNDFTQINDLGYGLVCANGGLSEMVSQFTYYCWAAYFSKNGSEIRSLNGSNAYGEYGLVAEGADPNEIPDAVLLRDNMVQPAKSIEAEVTLLLNAVVSVTAGDIVHQTVTLAEGTVVLDQESNLLLLKGVTGVFNTTNSLTGFGGVTPTQVTQRDFLNEAEAVSVYVYDLSSNPQNRGEMDILHASGLFARYEVVNAATIGGVYVEGIINPALSSYVGVGGSGLVVNIQKTIDNGYIADITNAGATYVTSDTYTILGTELGGATPANDATLTITADVIGSVTSVSVAGTVPANDSTPIKSGQVYRLSLTTVTSVTSGFEVGLVEEVLTNELFNLRQNQVFVFDDVTQTANLIIRPSTAILFEEDETTTYRSISFGSTESTGEQLPAGQSLVGFDSTFDYVRLGVNAFEAVNADVRGGGGTMGGTAADTIIAINVISELKEIERINAGILIFSWEGKVHQINNYVDRTTYATVEISDVDEIVNQASDPSGLNAPVVGGLNQITLRCGIQATADATITVRISTARATGHDFLDIGTGGFNSSNYPNVLLGLPRAPDQSKEVQEIGKGRVFYVSTDQDGKFRVGRFFTVDQGTGTVTFAAQIALSNLDGLGFKRGVVVSEFSTDTGLFENATDIVPVQSAIRGYIGRRLGFDDNGVPVPDQIGPGALAASGGVMDSNLNASNFTVTNLLSPSNPTDAATKVYTDIGITARDSFEKMRDVFKNESVAGQLVVSTGAKRVFVNNISGTIAPGQAFTNGGTATGTVIQVDVQLGDILYGNISIVTYTETGTPLSQGDTIDDGASMSAAVLRDPADEVANADFAAGSSVTSVITRTDGVADVDLVLTADSIINSEINASAGILQSKLALNAATTRANATSITQADLGVASFNSDTFTATDGWIEITDAGIALPKLATIVNNRILGNISGGTVQPYAVTATTGSGPDSVLVTQSDGSIRVDSLKLGGNDGYQILSLSGTQLNMRTPAQGTIFTAIGATDPTVNMPGSIDIGATSGAVTESILQQTSALTGKSRAAATWMYSSFIEAPGERGAASTGIAIGASTGITTAGEIGINVANAGSSTTLMPFKFDRFGVIPDANNIYNIGSASFKYNTVHATTFEGTAATARYADLAERYEADAEYEPGTVVVLGGEKEITVTNKKGDSRVLGVVSTDPAYTMNSHLDAEFAPAIALVGRAPCKVVGRIQKGDILVSSPIPGYACADNNALPGRMLGKAMEDNSGDRAVIEIAVGRA
tara:strand:- start:17743 stop:24807 length:7065 start_codon:yes stop_codon:yes gene_type:complete